MAMRSVHYWYASFAGDLLCDTCTMWMHRDVASILEECVMELKNVSQEERQMLVSALDLAIGSCERRGNRSGELQSVKDELAKHAEKYRLLKTQVTLTK